MAQTIKLKRSATQGASPTTSQLELGEVAINTYDGKMYIKKNVGGTESIVEVGAGSGSGGGLSSSFTLYEYTATANQTTFSGSDSNSNTLAYDTGTPPKILVYLNGVLLDHTTDYTATNGTSVVLTSGAAANDLVQVAAYKSESSVALDIALDDDVKLKLGDDDDLQIYHDGSTNNSVIKETGSGNLELWGNNVKIMNVAGTETQLNANPNGQVELYYDNSKKLETTSSGIQVQGAMASTTGTYSPIYYGGSSSLQLKSNSGELFGQFTNNGAAELYYDNTKKFETTSTGATITGNIAVTGTVDGRDLATDGSKLDNIESNADVTDTANVTAAGALMDSEVTNLAQVKAFDSSDYATAAQGTTADSAMQDLVDDTTPQLGGNLDLNSNNITGTGNISNTGTISSGAITSSGEIDVNLSAEGKYFEGGSGSIRRLSITSGTNISAHAKHTFDIASANGKYVFQTNSGDRLTLDSSGATFAGTISSGAITASSGADQILTLDQYTAGWNYIGFETNGTRKFYLGNGAGTNFIIGSDNSGVVLNISNFGSVDLNSANITAAGTISSGNITTSGYLAGPATFTIDPAAVGDNTGTVVIAGNLQVDGTTTTINSTTLTVDDKNITLASGSTNAAAANGAGITVDCGSGTDATLTYDGTNDEWDFNKVLKLTTPSTTTASITAEETSGATIRMAAGGSSAFIGTMSNHYLRFLVNSQERASLTANGDFTVTNDLKLTTTNPRIDYDGGNSGALRFFSTSAAQERMRITSGGNVGIGTTTPDEFSIGSTFKYLAVGGDKPGIINLVDDSTSGSFLQFGTAAGVRRASVHAENSSDLVFTLNSSNTGTSLAERVRIKASNGNVGIGISDPDQKLDVNGNIRIPNAGKIVFGSAGASPGDYLELNDVGSSGDLLKLVQDSTTRLAIQGVTGNVSIGVTTPFTVGGTAKLSLSTSTTVYLTAGASNSDLIYSRRLSSGHYQTQTYLNNNTGSLELQPYGGKVGIGTNGTVSATFQVEEAGIDTTTTTTTATTQVAIDTFAAATFRSARYTIQVTNSTDSTYHLTEVLLIHDGTTPQITEYGTIFTGSAEATFDADISSGNVRLLATPATTDSMTFKVVRHCITV